MGHTRLGDLPRTRRWDAVVGLLDQSPADTRWFASTVVRAAEERLRKLANEPTVGGAYWLLVRVTRAARSDDFVNQINRLGVPARPSSSALDIIALTGEAAERAGYSFDQPSDFTYFAGQALRSALSATVAQQGPSLFDSAADDVRRAFAAYSSQARFGELARRFFSNFLSRAMRAWVDRELAKHVVPGGGLRSTSSASDFLGALDTHTWEAAGIVESFAADWYSKRNWLTAGEISREEADNFVAQSLRKLRGELRRRAATS